MLSLVSGKASSPQICTLGPAFLVWHWAKYRGCGRHIPWSSLPGEQPSLRKPLETFLKKMSLWEGPGAHHAPSHIWVFHHSHSKRTSSLDNSHLTQTWGQDGGLHEEGWEQGIPEVPRLAGALESRWRGLNACPRGHDWNWFCEFSTGPWNQCFNQLPQRFSCRHLGKCYQASVQSNVVRVISESILNL